MFNIKKKSSTGWEDSSFGGYLRVLQDYPEIRMNYDIETEIPMNREDLSWYTGSKLMKLFNLRVKEFSLEDILLNEATEVQRNTMFKVIKYVVPTKKSITETIELIQTLDSELANLFGKYRNVIEQTTFMYPVEVTNKSISGDCKEGEGKGAETMESPASGSSRSVAKRLIGETSKYKDPRSPGGGESITGTFKSRTTFKLMPVGSATTYTNQQILYAEHLIKMLDISFDPKEDKIPNLQSGKMDIGKIATVPAGNSHVYYRIEENQATKPFSVCILMDESGSMQTYEYQPLQIDLVKILYKAFSDKLPRDKIFIYGHSDSSYQSPQIRIYNDKYNTIFEETIDNQPLNRWVQNYDGPVIEAIHEKIREMTDDSIIFIAISDGEPAGDNYGGEEAIAEMKQVIEKCKRDNFVTIGIGVQFGEIKNIYSYHTIIRDLSKTAKQVSTLVNHVVKVEFQS